MARNDSGRRSDMKDSLLEFSRSEGWEALEAASWYVVGVGSTSFKRFHASTACPCRDETDSLFVTTLGDVCEWGICPACDDAVADCMEKDELSALRVSTSMHGDDKVIEKWLEARGLSERWSGAGAKWLRGGAEELEGRVAWGGEAARWIVIDSVQKGRIRKPFLLAETQATGLWAFDRDLFVFGVRDFVGDLAYDISSGPVVGVALAEGEDVDRGFLGELLFLCDQSPGRLAGAGEILRGLGRAGEQVGF